MTIIIFLLWVSQNDYTMYIAWKVSGIISTYLSEIVRFIYLEVLYFLNLSLNKHQNGNLKNVAVDIFLKGNILNLVIKSSVDSQLYCESHKKFKLWYKMTEYNCSINSE